MRKFFLFLPIAILVGCSHLNTVTPLPCEEVADRDGLHEEMRSAKKTDEYLKKFGLKPHSEKMRRYIVDSSAVCHGNRQLR